MKRKCTSDKVIRVPIMVPIIIWIICTIVMTTLLGKQLIMKAARYKTVEESITKNILTASDITSTDYGGYVTNYIPTNGANVGWRIFHSDGENIYLIADDYIETQYVPAGKGGTAVKASGTRSFTMTNTVNDYTGWSDISSSSITSKWLTQYVVSEYTSTNRNMKATAYLMDTNQWSGFKDSSYAEYAIGGPTLELFTASYNRTHEDKMIETQVSSEIGYQVKWSTDSSYANYISGLDTSESLYVISNHTNANAMWLASPSARETYDTSSVSSIYYGGNVSYNYCSWTYAGVRPIVALKSNIQFEKQEDGTYKIVEDIKIASEKYHIENQYIMKIQPNTTVETLKANIQNNATDKDIYNNQELIKESDIVDTGMTIELKLGSQKVTFTLVVIGDTNGDGEADFKDLVSINSHRLNKRNLKEEYLLAADVNGDGVADFKDMVKINKFRLHKIKEL